MEVHLITHQSVYENGRWAWQTKRKSINGHERRAPDHAGPGNHVDTPAVGRRMQERTRSSLRELLHTLIRPLTRRARTNEGWLKEQAALTLALGPV